MFTVENDDTQSTDYRLQYHGRYAHRRDYVERALAGAGFGTVVVDAATLRQEAGRDVAGLVVAAQRQSN